MLKLTEIRSWQPEHQRGHASVMLDGHSLPTQVGATLVSPWRVLCLAPAEWLLISQHALPENRQEGLVLTDVTDGLSVLSIQGPLAREALSKGCGLDFEAHVFPVGQCARTRLTQITVIVDCVGEGPTFDLYIPRSYRQYLSDWLEDAGATLTAQLS